MTSQTMKGFTLIELMIAIAIIGILAGIAVPTYNTYVYKARISELISRTAGLKTSVTEQVAANGITNFTTMPPSYPFATFNANPIFAPQMVGTCAGAAGTTSTASGNVSSLCLNADGSITVTGTANTTPQGAAVLKFLPTFGLDGSISWDCRACAPAGTVAQFTPPSCQNTTCP